MLLDKQFQPFDFNYEFTAFLSKNYKGQKQYFENVVTILYGVITLVASCCKKFLFSL
jgi:hypothetical protein